MTVQAQVVMNVAGSKHWEDGEGEWRSAVGRPGFAFWVIFGKALGLTKVPLKKSRVLFGNSKMS